MPPKNENSWPPNYFSDCAPGSHRGHVKNFLSEFISDLYQYVKKSNFDVIQIDAIKTWITPSNIVLSTASAYSSKHNRKRSNAFEDARV